MERKQTKGQSCTTIQYSAVTKTRKNAYKINALSILMGATSTYGYAMAALAELALDEIVVTAQKREQSLQDVPIAISHLHSDAITNAGLQNISDITRQIPVLEVQSNNSVVSTNFRIRRVGNLGNIPTFEPAVGVFIDGAFRSRSIFGATELFDIERVEILRGPQSTLYGKNTTAGVIGIYTAKPSDEFLWRGELNAGNIEGAQNATSISFKGGVSGPLSDNVSGSLGGAYVKEEETQIRALANSGEKANENDRYSVRGQLLWTLNDNLQTRLILGTVQQDVIKQTTPDYFYDTNGFLGGIVLPILQSSGVSDTCTDNDPHNRISCIRRAATSDLNASEVVLQLTYEFNNGWSINSLTSWDYFKMNATQDDATQILAPLLRYHDTQENESWQQELRLASKGEETVDWLAGIFYYNNEFNRGDNGNRPIFLFDTLSDDPAVNAVNQQLFGTPIPLPVATQGQLGFLDSVLDTDYIGVYTQATWNPSNTFSVTAGIRWQSEEKDAEIVQSVNDPSPSIISISLSPAAVSDTGLNRNTNEVTWSISPQWFLTDRTMLYFTAAHGFKSGGFNTGFGSIPIANREFDDEDITHYEMGLKTTIHDDRIRLSTSVFSTEYKNYQDADFIGSQFTVGNAEKAKLEGIEVEGFALLTQNLTVDFALSYADFVYDKNTSGQCYPGRVPDNPVSGTCDLSGEHPVNAPELKSFIGVLYEKPVSWGEIYGRLDWSWTDEYNTSFSADPRLTQDAYSWINLRTGTRWNNYELVLWVENVTNEEVVNLDAVANVYVGDGSYQSFLQDPRSYGLTFRMNYH